jgi:hypothetical protein
MYMQTEIMFPPRVIPMLRNACGPEWGRLVDKVAALDETHPESLAFSLMMIRLDGCLECETDSFRAMRGCPACALQTVRRYRGKERELVKLYQAALKDVQGYLASQPPAKTRRTAVATRSCPESGHLSVGERPKEAALRARAG